MIKNLIRLSIMMWLSVLAVCAHAALELELTQGIDSAIPIALAPFMGESGGSAETISQVIANDLSNSGRFKILNTGSPISPQAGNIDYNYFRRQNADYLALGGIKSLGGDRLKVSMQLHQTVGTKQVLVNKDFTISRAQQRRLAHHLSDIIYQELTGDRGIFMTRIAYIVVNRSGLRAQYRLVVADADGYNPRVLLTSTQPVMSPAWSPNGRQIAFVSFEKKKAEIYSVDVASGARRLISSFEGLNNAPAWSPDGRQMALVLSKDGSAKIYVMNLATRQLRKVTDGVAIDTEPAFSPDGRSVLFTSNRGGSPQIYRLNLASGSTDRVSFDGDYNARASFSPDGRGMVLLHRASGSFAIAVQDLGSSRLSVLTDAGLDESPSFSPNGKMIIYATRNSGIGVLGVVSSDAKVRLRLPSREGDVQEPAWSPFLS